jgi:hypothetical protein
MKVKETDECGGWSQFEAWAGMNWFENKPLTPPCDKEDNVPITDSKYSTEHVPDVTSRFPERKRKLVKGS